MAFYRARLGRGILMIGGVVAACLGAELTLRALSDIHWLYCRGTLRANAHPDVARLLCIGESTTAMGGPDSYPRQLERLLNKSRPGRCRFEVVNAGIPAATTTEILEKLPSWIERYNPDAVIAMMGINDYDIHPAGFPTHERSRSRLWNLIRMLPSRLRFEAEMRGNARWLGYRMMGELYSAKDPARVLSAYRTVFKRYIGAHPADASGYRALSDVESLSGRNGAAEAYLRLALKRDSGNADYVLDMADILTSEGKKAQAKAWFKRSLGMSYSSPPYHWIWAQGLNYPYKNDSVLLLPRRDPASPLYFGSRGLYWLSHGRARRAEALFKKAEALRAAAAPPALALNYARLRRIVARYGKKLICVQYPMRPVQPLRALCGPQALIVDNEKSFKSALADRPVADFFTDFFAGSFGHATPRGNALIAADVARALSRNSSGPWTCR